MKNQAVIVTGGAGYIGSHICRDLAQNGFLPLVIDNLSTGLKELVQFGPLYECDLRNKQSLSQLIKQLISDYKAMVGIIDCAASISVEESQQNPHLYLENNIIGLSNLLLCLKENNMGDCPIIFSSTAAVYQSKEYPINEEDPINPLSWYGKSKHMGEEVLRWVHGGKVGIFRYFNAAGCAEDLFHPATSFSHLLPNVIMAAKFGKTVKVFGNDYATPDGTGVRDYVHVEDIARSHTMGLLYLVNQKEGFTVNLGSQKGYSVLQVIKTAEEVFSAKIDLEFYPRRQGDLSCIMADNTRAKSMGMTFNKDLKQMLSSYKSRVF